MRRSLLPLLVVLFAPMAPARVWTTVYRCDGTTPLAAVDPNHPTVYRDIMVGTRLVIVISSDQGVYWWGGLMLSQDEAKYATLSGRECARPYPDCPEQCTGSCLPAAGGGAKAGFVWYRDDDEDMGGIECCTNVSWPSHRAAAGDWFIVDYRADRVGTCAIGFYDYLVNFDMPLETLLFAHVPSRDFSGDTIVNFRDLALLTSHWGAQADPNSSDATYDLDADGRIALSDLALFSAYWLERTECRQPATDPNELSPSL